MLHSHVCEEIKPELDRAVQTEVLSKQDARRIYKRCLKSQKHND